MMRAWWNYRSSGRGEIGRRTRLRIWRRKAWGFKSLRPYTIIKGAKLAPFAVISPLKWEKAK